jgi:uncharacterized protein DUF4105
MRRRILEVAGTIGLSALVTLATAWGVLALYYFDLESAAARTVLAASFGMVGSAALTGIWLHRWRRRALALFALVFVNLLVWWSTIAPSNERDWKPGVAVLPYATFDGNRVTIHRIRNFAYRTESDFTVSYYDRTVDLGQLESVDLITSYWGNPAIAHVIVSFGFGADTHVAISIERRDERTEDYSVIKGLFRQYELFYVVADERDVVRLRTTIRRDPPEQAYLYRLRAPRANARRAFIAYLQEINSLREHPEFYNTVTTNCTTNAWLHARINPGHVPFSWKILVSGYLPEYLYEAGRLDTSVPFPELQRRSLIKVTDGDADFSRAIRAGLLLTRVD